MKLFIASQEKGPYIYFHWCEGKDGTGGPYDRYIKPWYTDRFWKFCVFETQEWKQVTQFWDNDWQGNGVRWNNAGACQSCNNWYVVKVWTQTYTEKNRKVETGETTTKPSGSEYSNVQRYVQYRAK